jgi:hypothetical protein
MSGACNSETCMLNSDVHIINGRLTTFVKTSHSCWHMSSLVYGVVTSRLYSCFEYRHTLFGGFVPSAEILFRTCFSIAINASNVLTRAAAYLFECTVFLSLCVHVFVFSAMLSTPKQRASLNGYCISLEN